MDDGQCVYWVDSFQNNMARAAHFAVAEDYAHAKRLYKEAVNISTTEAFECFDDGQRERAQGCYDDMEKRLNNV